MTANKMNSYVKKRKTGQLKIYDNQITYLCNLHMVIYQDYYPIHTFVIY